MLLGLIFGVNNRFERTIDTLPLRPFDRDLDAHGSSRVTRHAASAAARPSNDLTGSSERG